HARLHRTYRELIALRRTEPDLADPWLDHMTIDFDEEQRWVVLHRGALAIACNLGTEAVPVPVTGDLVAAWDVPDIGSTDTTLPGHSFAVLRTERVQ
ncbi:DUF3459 domain-containing protein, partial [Mycolicibacterium porcinum]